MKYVKRCDSTGFCSMSMDSGMEGPRAEVLETAVEGGYLLSSAKCSFRLPIDPRTRSSEVGGDAILLATWRELRDEERKVMVGKDSLFLR